MQRRNLTNLALWLIPIAFLAMFYFYPLGSILGLSISRGEGNTLATALEAINSPVVRKVLWFTIWQAALSTLLTLGIGLPGAYLFARYQFRGKRLLRAVTGVPFVLPTLVVATGFI